MSKQSNTDRNTKEQLDKAVKQAEEKIRKTLLTKGTDAAFKELMKHPQTGRQMDYEESRMYFG